MFRTYAKDLAALGGRAAQAVPPKQKAPAPSAPVPPPAPLPAPEPPPAHIIPKAPSTNESREAVLTRLRDQALPEVSAPTLDLSNDLPPADIIPKAPSTNESREAILNRLRKNAASVNRLETSAPAAVPPPPAKVMAPVPVPPAPQPVAAPAPLHTYKTDFADHIDAKKASTFSVLAAQSDAGTAPRGHLKERGQFTIAIVGGLLLILAGGTALFYAFTATNQEPIIPYVSNVPSLIFADERVKLEGEGGVLMAAWVAAAATPLGDGSVRVTYITRATTSPEGMPIDTPLPGGNLIAALALPAPEVLIRNVEPTSTVGVVHAKEETRAFFILKVSSYERTFAGMLEWEPRILADLEPLYPPYPQVALGTSTPSVTALPSFNDEIIANRDVRILRDTTGKSLMLYGYRDKETLIIARDEAAFTELLERLGASRGQ